MQFQVASVDSIIVQFSQTISLEVSQKIKFYFESIKKIEGIIDVIPSYTTLYIQYDIFHYDFDTLVGLVNTLHYDKEQAKTTSKLITIPVYYGVEVGLDLERISKAKNISIENIIQQHTKDIYTVYAIGFAPGFAYLGEVHTSIAMSRLETPRKMVPKGAVGIADTQTAVYPQNSPGGWNIIGKTPFEMFDKKLPELCPVNMGDTIQFKAINKEEFLSLGGSV